MLKDHLDRTRKKKEKGEEKYNNCTSNKCVKGLRKKEAEIEGKMVR